MTAGIVSMAHGDGPHTEESKHAGRAEKIIHSVRDGGDSTRGDMRLSMSVGEHRDCVAPAIRREFDELNLRIRIQ